LLYTLSEILILILILTSIIVRKYLKISIEDVLIEVLLIHVISTFLIP